MNLMAVGGDPYNRQVMSMSSDGGDTWAPAIGLGNTRTYLAASADGTRIVAAVCGNGGIYVAKPTPKRFLTMAQTGNTNLISWPFPSSGFELQENDRVSTGDWTKTPAIPTLNLSTLQSQVLLPASDRQRFFRLKHNPDSAE
jgi:hypothetical protein